MKSKKNNKQGKHRKKKTVTFPRIKLEQSEKIDLTANGGLLALTELIKRLGLIEKFESLPIFQRQRIGEVAHLLTLILNQFTGGDALSDTVNVARDEALKKLFGVIHIPAPHTSGKFLERFDDELLEKLRQIIWEIQETYIFPQLAKKLGRRLKISMDSSVYEVTGDKKEKTAYSFKRVFGYDPLMLHIHDTGEMLDLTLRGGDAFTAQGAAEMLDRNLSRLKPFFDKITFLGDAGFFDQRIVSVCNKHDIKFIITSEQNSSIMRSVESPENQWHTPKTPQQVEAKKTRTRRGVNYRLESLRKNLKKKHKQLKKRGKLEITSFHHTVASWKETYRFVFKRYEIEVEDLTGQCSMFESEPQYFYHGYITNIEDERSEVVITSIDGRGNEENYIKDFKHGLGTAHIPCEDFHANYAYFMISMCSWNLKSWLLLLGTDAPPMQWKRFRYLFVKVAVQIVCKGRELIVRFGKSFHRFREFCQIMERLRSFQFT